MKGTIAKLIRTYERLTYEQLPIASLLQRNLAEGPGIPEQKPLRVGDAEIRGVRCEFVSLEAASRLAFRTRLAPGSFFSAWIGELGAHSGAEFTVAARSEDQVLARIPIEGSLGGNSHRWHRVKLDLAQFSSQEITLFLSAEARSTEDGGVLGWGDPRILRKRGAREYYANLRSRLAEAGIRGLLQSVRAVLKGQPDPLSLFADYPRWLRKHSPTEQQLVQATESATTFPYQPLISILTPTFNTDPGILRSCVQSVEAQVYANWELCICDDGSTSEATRHVIAECARRDARIKAQFLQELSLIHI